MTVRASSPHQASAARTEADAALIAWHRGTASPQSVVGPLSRVANSAADFANLGVVLRATGNHGQAEVAYRRALEVDPGFAAANYNLGNLLGDAGQTEAAAQSYRNAIRHKPDYAEAWNGLGIMRQRQSDLPEAMDAFKAASRLAPKWAEPHTNLGVALLGLEQYEASRQAFQASLAADPSYAQAHGNLSALLLRAGHPIAAEAAARQAIARMPTEHRWLSNLAVALQMQARHQEAEACYRQALTLRPNYAGGHGNLLFALNYRDDLPAETIFAEYQRWDATHARPKRPAQPTYSLDSLANRRLRVGYVSPDFRNHAVALFSEPVLAAHDRSRIELFCYAEVVVEDATTARFRALADHWRPTLGLGDEAVAEMIRRDRIDVLVDLGGHTSASRLMVFAHKPAPVQVAWLLGHGYTSGLSAMDAFLADDRMAPVGADAYFSERLVRLPRIPIAYRPPPDMPPVVRPPFQTTGHITFGHFGRPERLNARVIAAWARILLQVPGSRLVLNNRSFQEPAFQALFAARFAAHDIARDRLDLIYTSPQTVTWAAYGTIDIALDPFPHNAGTTTIEALWQGVPVVSLADRPSVGRFGASILGSVGLSDWVAADVDTYVARAVAAANDRDGLLLLRDELRPRFAASKLHDAVGLARCLEITFQTMRENVAMDHSTRLRELFVSGDLAGARALAEQVLAEQPNHPLAAHVAGLVAYQENRYADADHYLCITTAANPGDPEPHANHSAILRKLGRLADAEIAARKALVLNPARSETQNNLGNILRDAGRFEESGVCFQEAIRLAPTFADAWANLSWVQSLCGRPLDAEHSAGQAIRYDPTNPNGHNNLGLALMRQSRLLEAEAALRQALTLKPDFALAHSNVLFCLNYRDDMTPEAIFAEYQRWDQVHARALAPAKPAFDLDRTPGRRLRIGYVSPDFRTHAVALFTEPLLAQHDRSQVEIFCYAELAQGDATTARFRAMADHWRPTIGLDDAAVAEMIRRDRIDVLIDLAGHTAGNRLLAFARKPAPVQIEFMLGHGYTSGLSAMDAFLSDAALTPPGADPLFSERIICLPRIPLAYLPPAGMPEVAPLPARANGRITFGYFGRTVRLNDAVIEAWSRILRAVPTSRLVLNNSPFAEPAGRDRMAARFAVYGIARDRLEMTCTSPQPRTWAAYGEIDIALDPFPHNAGTTTIEALWQGVPVVSLAGRPTVGRFGAAILHAVGLDDWVTDNVDAYVARAVAAADDIDALEQVRANLRPKFAASPMHDAPGLARTMEATYRALWDAWRGADVALLHKQYSTGDRDGAAATATTMLDRDPSHPDALHVLAVIAYQSGNAAHAIALLERAPERADLLTDRGVILRAAGRHQEAERCYRRALVLTPGFIPALGNLGNVLLDLSRSAEAEEAFSQALVRAPDLPWLLRGKALALLTRQEMEAAEPLLRHALSVAPDDAEVHETLGALLGQTGRVIEAEAHHRAGLPGLRDKQRGYGNLAVALQAQGRHQEAEATYRQAIAFRPNYASGHGNLLFALNYREDLSAETIFAEYQRWDAQHARPLMPPMPRFDLDLTPGRRLRVGYVSPDFRRHASALFAEPLLAAHDRSRIELFCYAELTVEDDATRRFQALADHWRPTTGMRDDALAEMIRRDRIDVLVDLAGHTGSNRLLTFARRPAPVQVEYILGHGTTTGMAAMDAFLADDALAPPEADMLFSERLIRLPRIPLVYQPPVAMPEVAGLPASASGRITFGYFGRVERVNQRVIATWSRILAALPGSRLVLNSLPFMEAAFRDLFIGRFAAHGIAADRLSLICTTPQSVTWAAYGEIDIALDPFPHNAGTTTIEALWQGVPVVSRADRPSVGRFGASILGAVGLGDWVAADDDAYVARALDAASNLGSLADMRRGLRARVEASPLRDADGLARAVEDAYRALWDDWRVRAQLPIAAE